MNPRTGYLHVGTSIKRKIELTISIEIIKLFRFFSESCRLQDICRHFIKFIHTKDKRLHVRPVVFKMSETRGPVPMTIWSLFVQIEALAIEL